MPTSPNLGIHTIVSFFHLLISSSSTTIASNFMPWNLSKYKLTSMTNKYKNYISMQVFFFQKLWEIPIKDTPYMEIIRQVVFDGFPKKRFLGGRGELSLKEC